MLPSCDSDNSPFDFLFDKRPSNSNFITYDQNPNSSQDDIQGPPFLCNFSSPFFDEHELPLNQILSQNRPTSENPCFAIPSAIDQIVAGQSKSMEIVEPSKLGLDRKKGGSNLNPHNGFNVTRKNLGAVPRRTKGKKDRHSKICTAQGIRDRRMRLSLQAARKFFDLQDLLGYDKASKTIEWLFNNSLKAINELVAKDHPQAAALRMSISTDAKSESLLSECEVVSGIGFNPNNEVKDAVSASAGLAPDSTIMTIQEETKKSQKSVASKPNQRKESREKARVRAKSRTRQKKMASSTDEHSGHISNPSEVFKLSNPNESYLEPRIGSSSNSLFESSHYQETMSSHLQERDFPQYYAVFRSFERDVGTIENLLGNTSSLSSASFSISDHVNCSGAAVSGYSSDLNNAFMGFLGNWDMMNSDQKLNNFQYGVSLEDNPNSICSATPDFL